ncbi:MAG: hypothetical protein NTV07_02300 [Candidatus Omnitrophica bacterium]|nr:hypothetical protein [Candidatus Omnitrophota bacterium]
MILQIKKKAKDVVGIDIGQGHITVTVLHAAPELEIKDLVVQKISADQPDSEISGIIREIFGQKQLFKKEVWLNLDLPESSVNYRRLSLPFMPEAELPNAIKWNLKDKVTLDVNNSKVAYEVIGELTKPDGSKNLDVTAVLVEKSLINRYVDIFKNAGVDLTGISLTPFSLANILSVDQVLAGQKEPVVLCHIGIEYCYICIAVNGKVGFVRHIPLAERSFLTALTGALVSDKGRVELTLEDARKIMEEFGIPRETDVVLGGKVAAGQVLAMIRPVIERFIGELSRSIEYYQREFGAKIEIVFLTGIGSYIKGLGDFISKGVNLKIGYLKLPKGVLNGAAFGAAVGPKNKLNLLPEELKQKKQQAIQATALRLSTVTVLGILFFSFLTLSLGIASYRRQLVLLNHQKTILKEFKEMQRQIESRQAVISAVRNREVPIDLVLKGLSNITSGNVAFSQIWLNQKQKALKISGKVTAKPETVQGVLSDFMTKLEASDFIKEAQLTNVQRTADETSSFNINCELK